MKLALIVFTLIILSSCNSRNNEKSKTEMGLRTKISQEKNDPSSEEIIIDSVLIYKKLRIDNIYRKIEIEKGEISIPFQYSIKLNKESNNFEWHLCDLFIDGNSSNYSQYRLTNNIPYSGNIGNEGQIHFVKTYDSTAVTTEKFKVLNKIAYKKIYYSDKESVIYQNSRDNITVIQFKYLKDRKEFAIYSKVNEDFFSKASEEDILDLSITQLRVAKNLFKEHKNNKSPNWNAYKNTLSKLELKKLKSIINLLTSSIDTLALNTSFSYQFGGNIEILSIIKIDNEGKGLWNAINKIPSHNFIDFFTVNNSEITNYVAFLRSRENFIKREFKDDNSIILMQKPRWPNYFDYAIFKKTKIKDSDILLFTGGSMNYGEVRSKEIAYFYLKLLNNYNDL